jgi:5-formyltetrahydrofolate cyclo-ligase
MPDTPPKHSTDFRREKRALRQALSPTTQQLHSQAITTQITKDRDYRNANHIACYLANDGEIDPYPIIEHAWFMGKTVYLPILSPLILSPLKNQLYFAPYEANSRLKHNRFKIPEPVCKPSQWKTARQLDLLLVPLVAFDANGNRMGMGGGFYDRSLAHLKHRQYWKKPRLIGLAHECQKVDKLNVENWDIPLNKIITEAQIYNR